MENHIKLSRAQYDMKYHIACVTKYRKQVTVGKIVEKTC